MVLSWKVLQEDFNGDTYYENTIGVTVLNEEQLQEVIIKVDHKNAPYVLTKPFHSSQELMERTNDNAMIFKMKVHLNFELERLILGFGDSIEVPVYITLAELYLHIYVKIKRQLSLVGVSFLICN